MSIDFNAALGILQAVLSVAGLLLVFTGFLFSKAESYETRRGDKFKTLAKFGIVPLIGSFFCAALCLMVMEGNTWASTHVMLSLKIALGLSALYSIISLWSL